MANIIKSSLILAIIGFIASLALSHVNNITYPNIIKQQKLKQEKALSAVLPGYKINEEKKETIDNTEIQYWTAEKTVEKNKIQKGYAFIAENPGYSGPVRSMVGIDDKGIILGISILQQSETPGLGARSTEIASKMTFLDVILDNNSKAGDEPKSPWFEEQYKGLDTSKPINIVKKGDWKPEMREELLSGNSISAITGATITSRAVTNSIMEKIEKLMKIINREAK